jgi:hypothetical protein
MLLCFMKFWNILRPFCITYSLLISIVVFWYIFSALVCLDQEKSGNPGSCNSAGVVTHVRRIGFLCFPTYMYKCMSYLFVRIS